MTEASRILPGHAVDPEALCATFNAAFADYLAGPPNLLPEHWAGFLRRQGVSLGDSRVVVQGDHVLAFALVGRRGAGSRLATMGARPEARGTGAAPRLLDRVLEEARARGHTRFELEVFAQNERALRLYAGRGFAPLAELYGYRRPPATTGRAAAGEPPPPAPEEVTRRDAAAWLRARDADLPYQASGDALETAPPTLLAWRRGDAQLAFVPRDEESVSVVSLVDVGPDQDDARVLVRALVARFPDAALHVPQLQRADLGGRALEAEGFVRLELHQLLLRRSLGG